MPICLCLDIFCARFLVLKYMCVICVYLNIHAIYIYIYIFIYIYICVCVCVCVCVFKNNKFRNSMIDLFRLFKLVS